MKKKKIKIQTVKWDKPLTEEEMKALVQGISPLFLSQKLIEYIPPIGR